MRSHFGGRVLSMPRGTSVITCEASIMTPKGSVPAFRQFVRQVQAMSSIEASREVATWKDHVGISIGIVVRTVP